MHDFWKKCAEEEVVQALKMAVVAPDEVFTEKDNSFPFKCKEKVQKRVSTSGFHPSFYALKTLL